MISNDLSVQAGITGKSTIEWNKDEVMGLAQTVADQYKGLVYTDEQIKEAKADRAKLNKLLTAIGDERKKIKAAVEAPYTAFNEELKEVTSKLEDVRDEIDRQVKAYEKKQDDAKTEEIRKAYEESIGDLKEFVSFEKLFSPKMLNKSVTNDDAADMIRRQIESIRNDLAFVDNLGKYTTAARKTYFDTLDLGAVTKQVNEMKRIEAAAEVEAKKAKMLAPLNEEQKTEPEDIYEMTFTVSGTMVQLKEVKAALQRIGVVIR